MLGVYLFLPPGCSLSSVNLLYREDFLWSVLSIMILFQSGQSALCWLLKGVRIWKLNRKYPGEKLPSLSLPTQGCCFATHKPTRHLLTIPNIPAGCEPLRGSDDPFSSTCPVATTTSFPRLIKLFILEHIYFLSIEKQKRLSIDLISNKSHLHLYLHEKNDNMK